MTFLKNQLGQIDRVVVLSDDSTDSGGAAAVMRTTVEALRRKGLPVTLINGHLLVDDRMKQMGVEVVSLGGKNLLESEPRRAAWIGLYDKRMYEAVRTWIAANDTPQTVYHLHNWHKVLTPAVMAALHPVRRRLLLTIHDYFLACPNGAFFNFRTSKTCHLRPMSLACVCSNCDRRSYVHKLWRTIRHGVRLRAIDLKTLGPRLLMPHPGILPFLKRGGIHTGRAVTLRNLAEGWHKKRIPAEENKTIFFVGRVATDKGADALAEAGRCAGLSITVIGDGPLRKTLAEQYPEHRFLGQLPREQIARLTEAARLVVVPTRWPETFGLVALEALLSGIPVLISQQTLIAREIVKRGMGQLCDPEDIPALTRLLRRLVDDDATISQMSQYAIRSAADLTHDQQTWAERLVGNYASHLAGSMAKRPLTANTLSPHVA